MRLDAGLFVTCLFALSVSPLHAQVEPEAVVSKSLGELYAQLRSENYTKALKQADEILRGGQPEDQLAVSVAYGRILLGLKNRAAAEAYLRSINTAAVTNAPNGDPLPAYEAWLKHLNGDSQSAAADLEAILKEGDYDCLAIAESADVLAQIKIANSNLDDATGAIRFALGKIKYEGLKTSYIEAILRRRLKQIEDAGKTPAEKLYEQAEGLRRKDRFADALPVYQEINREYSESEWADPAGYRIGQCLVGMQRQDDAIKYWTDDFIGPNPGAPYRGQAIIKVAEYHLQERLDLVAARTALASAEPFIGPAADNSWMAAKHKLCILLGIVAYVRNDQQASRDWFTQAKRHAPPRPTMRSVGDLARPPVDPFDEMVKRLDRREAITPEFARQGDEKSSLLCVMGDVCLLIEQGDQAAEFFTRVVERKSGARPSKDQLAHAQYRLIQVEWTKNNGEQMIEMGKQFLAQHSKHEYAPDVLLHCGIVFHSMLKNPAMSMTTFQNVRKRYPGSKQAKTALWQMATIHRWNGNYDKATQLYQQYKRQYPDDPGIDFIDRAIAYMKDPENKDEPLAVQ